MHPDCCSPSSFEWNNLTVATGSPKPPSRWGHSSCIIDDDLYIFGGFANSSYMNDLWVYSLNSMQWKEIVTSGDVPQIRSNATLSYDNVNNQLLLFGGGGPRKHRYNTVSYLDLDTLNWVEIAPFESEAAPWERTYHIAEFKYPYLIIFGGQSADDLGDLWVYDVRSLSWKEAKNMAVKPSPRRFQASCLVGNKIYVSGGCHGKYSCLGDIYCLDISKLVEEEKMAELKWELVECKGETMVERWGHTMDHFDGYLYIWGGRSDEDLKDLVSVEIATGQVRTVTTVNDPSARRRHSGGFIGSSLVLFGGFDGVYFDDLFYINLYKTQSQGDKAQDFKFPLQPSDENLFDAEGEFFGIYAALLGKYFKEEQHMLSFLKAIDGQYFKKQLKIIFTTLYKGWGSLPLKPAHFQPLKIVPTEEYQTSLMLVHSFMELPHLPLEQSVDSPFVELETSKYQQYMTLQEEHWQMDRCLILNNEHKFSCCPRLMNLFSHYFHSFFSSTFKQSGAAHLQVPCELEVFRIILAYLHSNILVVPRQHHFSLFKDIAKLAEYFSLTHLFSICQKELSRRVSLSNYKDLLPFSHGFGMNELQQVCSLTQLSQLTRSSSPEELSSAGKIASLGDKSQQLFKMMKFDLVHKRQQSPQSKQKPLQEMSKQNQDVPQLQKKESLKKRSIFD